MTDVITTDYAIELVNDFNEELAAISHDSVLVTSKLAIYCHEYGYEPTDKDEYEDEISDLTLSELNENLHVIIASDWEELGKALIKEGHFGKFEIPCDLEEYFDYEGLATSTEFVEIEIDDSIYFYTLT